MKKKSDCCLRSMKTRACRGEPRLPNVLYSPYFPEVKMEFIYIKERVSGTAGVLSPNRSSTVHTFSPRGTTLCWLWIESDRFRRLS